MKKNFLIILFLTVLSLSAHSQILISILLGDKLNSEKIEFGIFGGLNQSYFTDISDSKPLNTYDLGFYFHFLVKNNSYISTGLLVKSSMGASGMPTYKIGDEDFDNIYKDGSLTTKINYIYLPIMFQQRIWDIIQLEGGFKTGIRTGATDSFYLSAFDGDLSYKKETKKEYSMVDAGLQAGIGFKLSKRPKSMSIGVNYYQGLMNISKKSGTEIKNSALNLFVTVPIGIEKSSK